MFDPPSMQPYVTEFPTSVVNTPDHQVPSLYHFIYPDTYIMYDPQATALQAAREGIVLLKNDGLHSLITLSCDYHVTI